MESNQVKYQLKENKYYNQQLEDYLNYLSKLVLLIGIRNKWDDWRIGRLIRLGLEMVQNFQGTTGFDIGLAQPSFGRSGLFDVA